jgi:hypothetical protein
MKFSAQSLLAFAALAISGNARVEESSQLRGSDSISSFLEARKRSVGAYSAEGADPFLVVSSWYKGKENKRIPSAFFTVAAGEREGDEEEPEMDFAEFVEQAAAEFKLADDADLDDDKLIEDDHIPVDDEDDDQGSLNWNEFINGASAWFEPDISVSSLSQAFWEMADSDLELSFDEVLPFLENFFEVADDDDSGTLTREEFELAVNTLR